MSRRIQILPDHLANQIAAGEVVERPASVVKELVENALDAAATRVEIVLRNGGKTEIRIADDGGGMSREDALLSLDRHATSKIRSPDDLRDVRSFGFRGEALPSIASVSRFTLETAEAGGIGTRVQVDAGRVLSVEDCARQRGTTVVVRSLFANLPARSKFLKSASVETRAAADALTGLVLANLSAGFRLVSNDRVLLDLPPADGLPERVAALWGDEFAARLVPVRFRDSATGLAGLVERPAAAGSGPRRTHLFVGGRPIRDRGLLQAVDRAFRTTVPEGVRPSLLLYLELGAGDVDVNIHPAKAEVRFRDRAAVEAAVEAAVREALGRAESAATLDPRGDLAQLRHWRGDARPLAPSSVPLPDQLAFFAPSREPGASPDAAFAAGDSATAQLGGVGDEAAPATPIPRPSLWQVHDTYVLAETRSGLLIIDQHSAHERILFEEMMRALENGGGTSQRLLFPLTLRLSPAEYGVVEEVGSYFKRAGYEIEPFGGRTVIVHGAPDPHPYFDAERCLREMLAELAAGSELTRAARNQHERIAMTFACKAAVKAGQRLARSEMEELFDKLFTTELPHHDVHGRPTVIRLSVQELERRFGRHG